MLLSKKRITKALIRLRGCAGWSAPLLFANHRRQVFSRRGPYYSAWYVRYTFNNKKIKNRHAKIVLQSGGYLEFTMAFFIFIQILIEHSEVNSGYPDQMPCSAVSHLDMHGLPMSHKKDARLI